MNDHELGWALAYIGRDDIFSLINLGIMRGAPDYTNAAPASQGPLIQWGPIKTEIPIRLAGSSVYRSCNHFTKKIL